MFKTNTDIAHTLGEFKIKDCSFSFHQFIPRIYNYCKESGFAMDKIMPSRAFCSDENQGFPSILMTKHFGHFPFNHGRVGGVMATARHKPHAAHGKDVIIIQASHVGYQAEENTFGHYRRLCTEDHSLTHCCGKLASTIEWYQKEFEFAKNTIFLQKVDGKNYIIIDNQLLDNEIKQGLQIKLDMVVQSEMNSIIPYRSYSTSKCFIASEALNETFADVGECVPIGDKLRPEYFFFKKELGTVIEGVNLAEYNLQPVMPWIVTAPSPLLTAAKVNVQVEFDRAFRSIAKEPAYHGKNLIYIAGLNIDVSPAEDQIFPVTMFAPWAMYQQYKTGEHRIFEQPQLVELLNSLPTDNPDQVELDDAIRIMQQKQTVVVNEPMETY